MDWKTKNNPGKVEASPEELKICELCGTLNYSLNTECFTCGWKGRFSQDEAEIDIAWRRLSNEFEAVRLEHVTARRAPILGDFGLAKKTSPWQRLQARWSLWYRETFRRPSNNAARKDRNQTKQPTGSQNDIIA